MEQSPYSPSEVDTTGGLADRHRAVREILSGAKDATAFAKASAEYSSIFYQFEAAKGKITSEQVADLINTNIRSVRIFFVEWQFKWMTFALQKDLVDRSQKTISKTGDSTITTTTTFTINKLTDFQLLQKYGGKSSQTLQVGLIQQKALVQKYRGIIAQREADIERGYYGSSNDIHIAKQLLQQAIDNFNKASQLVWEYTNELARRKR